MCVVEDTAVSPWRTCAELWGVRKVVSVNGCVEAGSWHDELRPWASQTAQWSDVLPPHKPDNVHSSLGPHSRRTELSLLDLSSDLDLCTMAHASTFSHIHHIQTVIVNFKSRSGPEKNRPCWWWTSRVCQVSIRREKQKHQLGLRLRMVFWTLLLAVIFEASVCFCSVGNWTRGPQAR